MSTQFILWPVAVDAAFRPAYAALTGETIQTYPALNAGGDLYMVGTSRAQPAACAALAAAFPGMRYGENPAIFGWIPAEENDTISNA